ncbi:MAG TPA: FtsX-like permease family protein [bacterium]|nr:FtsX-like permease family protein [bacterium]
MKTQGQVIFVWQALTFSLLRSALVIFSAAIGVTAVILLTALGEGARLYISNEFSQLGSDLLVVRPGKNEKGGWPGLIFETETALTLQDAKLLDRLPHVSAISPLSLGKTDIYHQGRLREATLIGTSSSFLQIHKLALSSGEFIPKIDFNQTLPVAIIGSKIADEFFGHTSPLGERIRIGGSRFRIIGVLKGKGVSLGQDIDEIVIIPVANAQELFNDNSLFRIMIESSSRSHIDRVKTSARQTLIRSHKREDFTLITQDAVLSAFDSIFFVMTLSVGAIAAISLLVAGIIIMNVMLVSVSQRRAEIGLLMAVGAPPQLVLRLFLLESLLLGVLGALAGILLGRLGVWALAAAYPGFPLVTPMWAYLAAAFTALGAGLLFGWLPARRAAQLDPVRALTGR